MSGKTYTLEVSETELARVIFVIGKVNGITDGKSMYRQACDILWSGRMGEDGNKTFNSLHEALGTGYIDYDTVQQEWEKALGIGKSKKSPVQKRIENLEKELDELKKLL